MSLELGHRRVVAPDGVEWRVGRRWLTRSFRWSWKQRSNIASESLGNVGFVPVSDNVDFGEGLLLIVALVAAVLVVIPVLFFGFELIILGALLAGGLVSRVVLRKPWVIEATAVDPLTSGRQLQWQVRGWRRSRRLIDEVASDLSAGREPPAGTLLS
jgi:hypothetical protein